MEIGQVIRKYRKEKDMTQEEMARRLGVTAPAVNKWESGASAPDIALLAPIARMLGITTDTLLCFREALTEEEIRRFVQEAGERLRKEDYDDVFNWAKSVLEQYPNCDSLIWQMALLLDVPRRVGEIPEEAAEQYDAYISSCYARALESGDEGIRLHGAAGLFGFYFWRKNTTGRKAISRTIPRRIRRGRGGRAISTAGRGGSGRLISCTRSLCFPDTISCRRLCRASASWQSRRRTWRRPASLWRSRQAWPG